MKKIWCAKRVLPSEYCPGESAAKVNMVAVSGQNEIVWMRKFSIANFETFRTVPTRSFW
jgi:hypothetical protein